MHPESKAAIVYRISADGSCCYSMRSRGDFDVSEVCKQFGGGGHFSASGYNIKALQPSDPRIVHEWITP
jgi:nanoRNase/pAp phosphatase (c-di-AMP/oligoRNAs hydrolase)